MCFISFHSRIFHMKAETAAAGRKQSVSKKTVDAKMEMGTRRMITRQTTAKINQSTVFAKENNTKKNMKSSNPTLVATEGKRKGGRSPAGARRWSIKMSELDVPSITSHTKKKRKETVKTKAPKKQTKTVVVKKRQKKGTAALVGAKKVSTNAVNNGKRGGKVVAKRVVVKEDKKEKVSKVVKVAKLTTVALKKHEMRNDDLVTIRPPNRSVP